MKKINHFQGSPTKNRTWNERLGNACYIHLTMGPKSEFTAGFTAVFFTHFIQNIDNQSQKPLKIP